MIAQQCKQEWAAVDRPGACPGLSTAAPANLFERRYSWPLLLLAGYLLFAHGCHGDEDNELFSAIKQQLAANNAQVVSDSR